MFIIARLTWYQNHGIHLGGGDWKTLCPLKLFFWSSGKIKDKRWCKFYWRGQLPIFLSFCLFVFLSFCLFVFLSFCLFVFLSNYSKRCHNCWEKNIFCEMCCNLCKGGGRELRSSWPSPPSSSLPSSCNRCEDDDVYWLLSAYLAVPCFSLACKSSKEILHSSFIWLLWVILINTKYTSGKIK